MKTTETVEIMTDCLKEDISKIKFQIERLDDIAVSIDDHEVEQDLRNISAEIRKSLDAMRNALEPDDPWLAG
jgi:hypothetical protein